MTSSAGQKDCAVPDSIDPETKQHGGEPSLEAWCRFLSAATDQDLETLVMQNPGLKPAKDALDRLSADPEARARAEQREMALISNELDFAKVRRQGWEEGLREARQEGARREGKVEMIHHLLTLRFGKLPTNFAQRLASGSEAELVLWSDRLLFAETVEGVFE